MPTTKFKSFEEAAAALLLQPRPQSPAARMRALFGLSARISPRRHATGVRKFRSHEEADQERMRAGK